MVQTNRIELLVDFPFDAENFCDPIATLRSIIDQLGISLIGASSLVRLFRRSYP